jgi:hypothetical protein
MRGARMRGRRFLCDETHFPRYFGHALCLVYKKVCEMKITFVITGYHG